MNSHAMDNRLADLAARCGWRRNDRPEWVSTQQASGFFVFTHGHGSSIHSILHTAYSVWFLMRTFVSGLCNAARFSLFPWTAFLAQCKHCFCHLAPYCQLQYCVKPLSRCGAQFVLAVTVSRRLPLWSGRATRAASGCWARVWQRWSFPQVWGQFQALHFTPESSGAQYAA